MATASFSDLYLAEELIFQILSWLPVLSLLHFKYVCKSWFSIISSPTFIETHLINSKKKQPSSLIWLSGVPISYSYFIHDGVYNYNFLDDPVRINFPQDFIGTIRCFLSCNGLVYNHVNRYMFGLCDVWIISNPLTKWWMELPAPEKKSVIKIVKTGFCFDYISSDYKILRVVYGNVIEAELYSASANSWKEIQIPNALQSSLQPGLGSSDFIHANGVLYSICGKKILAFDLHSEEFKVFPYPKPIQNAERSYVLHYEGSAAVLFGEVNGDKLDISLWTFNEVSWTKKFNFVDHLKIYCAYLYLGVGQFVARDSDYGYIIYDHRKKQTKKFPLPLSTNSLSLAMYTESLVSFEGLNNRSKVW